MKKILLILLVLVFMTGCSNAADETKDYNKDVFAVVDQKFSDNNISFSRNVKLNQDNYYAKEAYQYVIDDASCIVDIYYFGEDSDIYKDAYEKKGIRAKEYDNKYVVATIKAGFAAIVWDGCSKKQEIESILQDL